MLVNIAILLLGTWGCHYTWTKRSKSGGSPFFDMASSVHNPVAYKFAIGIRIFIFGLCIIVGLYRIVFGIVT